MKIKRGSMLVSAFLFIIVLTSLVSAFGVASEYYPGHPLVLAKGETKIVNLNLQNMVGDQDINIRGYIVQGSELASMSQTDYLVMAQSADTMVPITITIPKDAQAGQTTKIIVGFATMNTGNSGMVSLDTAVETSFEVNVSAETAKVPLALYLTLGIIALLILVIVVLLGRKKTRSRKK